MIHLQEWDAPWTCIHGYLDSVAASIRAARPQARITIQRITTTFFPFGATLVISRNGIAGEEDFVISINGHVRENGIRISVDISHGSGYVVADGPELEIAAGSDLAVVLEPWFGAVERWLKAQTPLLIRELQ